MHSHLDYGKFVLDYDPSDPLGHLRSYGLEISSIEPSALLPTAIPWPSVSKPTPQPLTIPPDPSQDLGHFKDYDAIVVTWTVAEATSMATIFTPGIPLSGWYKYQHNVSEYIPLVKGGDAPFNDPSHSRYYHTMGLYFPIKIGGAKVLLFKSGLHLDYDGPDIPVKKLMQEIFQAVQPKVFITTGTGGAIGTDVLLGDVVIGTKTKFDCAKKFPRQTWNHSEFPTSTLPAKVLVAIDPALTKVNGSRIPGGNPVPKIWNDVSSTIVTTGKFAFDDSTDHDQLQGLGNMCDMGDAMVAYALQPIAGFKFFAIRNASDPQIPNPGSNYADAYKKSTQIYAEYGAITTAASLIATWAAIDTVINNP